MTNPVEMMRCRDLRREIKGANPDLIEPAICFLEEYSRGMGSGYIRDILWRYIRRYALDALQINRLEQAALTYLQRPMCR